MWSMELNHWVQTMQNVHCTAERSKGDWIGSHTRETRAWPVVSTQQPYNPAAIYQVLSLPLIAPVYGVQRAHLAVSFLLITWSLPDSILLLTTSCYISDGLWLNILTGLLLFVLFHASPITSHCIGSPTRVVVFLLKLRLHLLVPPGSWCRCHLGASYELSSCHISQSANVLHREISRKSLSVCQIQSIWKNLVVISWPLRATQRAYNTLHELRTWFQFSY